MNGPVLTDDALRRNWETIMERVDEAARQSGRSGKDITILAATKTQSAETINRAIALGVSCIGENRVQELLEKYDAYDRLNCSVQFIGHLQANKVKYLADKVDMIQSVDSVKLAAEIDRQCGKLGRTMDVLIEVNIGREAAKSGVLPEQLEGLLREIAAFPRLCIRGLMTIPPICESIKEIEQYFSTFNKEFLDIKSKKIDNVSMDILSMGMSGDYDSAVRQGANMIRIGTALFGSRN